MSGETVVVVGGGGREHALALALHESESVGRVFITEANPGAEAFAERAGFETHEELADFCLREKVGLVVVGPEAPLAAGIADDLSARGVCVFGPTRAAARLESSKIWAKEFMRRHGIPTADFCVCESPADAEAWIGERAPPYVLKADGLAAGKGVAICESAREARARAAKMLAGEFGRASRRVLLEEHLTGAELSFIAAADGRRAVALATSRDHKRLLENDEGPNTGGMGAISPAPESGEAFQAAAMRRVIQPALEGMAKEGAPYRGFLYAGLMREKGGGDDGFSVLEFNCRLGDPEAQALLPRARGDLFCLLAGAARGDLSGAGLEWAAEFSAAVVVAARGYPAAAEKGREVELPVAAADERVYCAGVRRGADGGLLTSGGRVACAVALAEDAEAARKKALGLAERVRFEGAYFRRDIGAV